MLNLSRFGILVSYWLSYWRIGVLPQTIQQRAYLLSTPQLNVYTTYTSYLMYELYMIFFYFHKINNTRRTIIILFGLDTQLMDSVGTSDFRWLLFGILLFKDVVIRSHRLSTPILNGQYTHTLTHSLLQIGCVHGFFFSFLLQAYCMYWLNINARSIERRAANR